MNPTILIEGEEGGSSLEADSKEKGFRLNCVTAVAGGKEARRGNNLSKTTWGKVKKPPILCFTFCLN
jgi:hypothetical protein